MMKTTDAITMITFLLVAITASDVVSAEKEVVLDTEGNPVKANKPYFIRLVLNSSDTRVYLSRHNWYRRQQPFSGGGENRAYRWRSQNLDPRLYPDTVAFAAGTLDPVIFLLRSYSDVVSVSTELYIRFKIPSAYSSGVWRVQNLWQLKRVIASESWSMDDVQTFTIQKLKGGYRFAFGSADKPVTICAKGEVRGTSFAAPLILSNAPYIAATHPSLQVNESCFRPVEFVRGWIQNNE